jgi:hypothetical protein
MAAYKLQNGIHGETLSVLHLESEKSIPFDPANTDYQAYLAWVAEGNTPEPSDD